MAERQVLEAVEKHLRYSKKKRKNQARSPATADVYLSIVRRLITKYKVLTPDDDFVIKVQDDMYVRGNLDSSVRQTRFAIDNWREALGAPEITIAKPSVAKAKLDPLK